MHIGSRMKTIGSEQLAAIAGGVTVFGQMARTLGSHYAGSAKYVGTTMGHQYRDAGRAVINAYRW